MGCLKLTYDENPSPLYVSANNFGGDENSGLEWNSFELRMYDPVIGRWTTPDPYGEFYSPYVGMGNNPINLNDPTGGFTCPSCPDGAEYDAYRNSDQAFAYDPSVGVYNDLGSVVVLGSRHFDNIQVVSAGVNQTVVDFMQAQRDLKNIENMMATFNEDNVAMILLMAEGGGIQGKTPKGFKPVKPPTVPINTVRQLAFKQNQLWKKFGEHYKEFGLVHGKEGLRQYLNLAEDVLNNYTSTVKYADDAVKYAGETHYFRGDVLLRVDSGGSFRSLYKLGQ